MQFSPKVATKLPPIINSLFVVFLMTVLYFLIRGLVKLYWSLPVSFEEARMWAFMLNIKISTWLISLLIVFSFRSCKTWGKRTKLLMKSLKNTYKISTLSKSMPPDFTKISTTTSDVLEVSIKEVNPITIRDKNEL